MKVRLNKNLINLRGETEEERELLDEMWKHGVAVFGGGSELGICSKKHFGSASQRSSPNPQPRDERE